MDKREQKSNLARLLATENITVEHNNVQTAQFDIVNRILTLPVWKEMSNDLYDMLCGHEVGHALYTPDWSKEKDSIVKKVPHSYLNVLEDIRIDRKIKQKYPGLKSSYFKGQGELRDRGFFGTKDRPLNTFKFIDRINIYSKNGSVEPVPFSDEEKILLDRALKTETFDDVVNLAIDIAGYAKEEKTPEWENQSDDFQEGDFDDDMEEQESSGGNNDNQEQDEEDTSTPESGENESGEEETKQEEKTSSGSEGGYSPDSLENQIGSETDKSFNDKLKQFNDKEAKHFVYTNLPEPNLDYAVVDHKIILDKLNSNYKKYTDFNKYAFSEFNKFKKETMPVVNYMVKEFEMKKSADEYKRATVSKTGVINVNKLHAYKYVDDIFKKMTVIPGSKNHGVVIILDHSGSMGNSMYGTMVQLFNLTMFCKQVGIPFEVYSFTDIHRKSVVNDEHISRWSTDYDILDPNNASFKFKAKDKWFENSILLNWVSSKQSLKQYNNAMLNLYKIALEYRNYNLRFTSNVDDIPPHAPTPHWARLGGTPLNSAIVITAEVVKRFQSNYNIQKMNTIFLTDGASHDSSEYVKYDQDGKLIKDYTSNDSAIRLRDNKIKYDIKGGDYRSNKTTNLLKWFRVKTNSQLIGFYLYSGRTMSYWDKASLFGKDWYNEYDKQRKLALKSKVMISKKAGYEKLFITRNTNLVIEDEELNINENMTVSQMKRNFGKTQKSKLASRVMLNKFIELVA